MSGRIVMIQGRVITVEMGTVTRQFTVSYGSTITLNGKEATLDELEPNDQISFSGDPNVNQISATR
jgi:hypothetical protein